MKNYTGIGSRETPSEIMSLMIEIAHRLAKLEYTLRSGGADGADTAFEKGCDLARGTKEIYLPWKGFNNNQSKLFDIPPKAALIASETHPRWKYLRLPIQKLMARNTLQILGMNVETPTEFVICWTSDGCVNNDQRTKETGGTGQAIALAASLGIPVYNLQRETDRDMILEKLHLLETK